MTPAARFEAVRRVIADQKLSERPACRLLGMDRSGFQYGRNGSDDGRLAILLRREGRAVNLKRVYRLYSEERLMARKRGG